MKQANPRIFLLLVLLCLAIGAHFYFKSPVEVDSAIETHQRLQPINLVLPKIQSPYIDDQSQLLGAFAHHLHRMAQDWLDTLGIEVQVVTLEAPDQKIAELANALFREREIGKDAATGGLLILIEAEQGAARIEVSYELEALFTDALVGLLAHDQLAPYASYKAVGMAIMDVMHFLKDHALEQAVLGTFNLPEVYRQSSVFKSKQSQLSGGAGAQVEIFNLPTDVDFKKPVPADQLPSYLPAETPEQTLEAFKRSLKQYVGDPDLPLFTEGSQILRKLYPFAPYESLTRLRRLVASEPLQIVTRGQYAVVISDKPVHGFTPVLMRQVDGKWRIDLVEKWKNIFFNSEGNYYLKNNNTAYAFGLHSFGNGQFHRIEPLPVGEGRLKNVLGKLANRDDAISHYQQAELLFRNAFAALEALKHYEYALTMAPNDPLFQSTYIERVMYLGFPELAIPILIKIGVPGARKLAEALVAAQHPALAVEAARHLVNDNPYSLYTLRTLKWALEQAGQDREAADINQQINRLRKEPGERYQPVWLTFHPKSPLLRARSPIQVNNTTVYDHSQFSVTLKNYSNRPVKILSVQLVSAGTGSTSGLGDITKYWQLPSSENVLAPGESHWFDKTWGFTIDPGHDRLSYIFHVCWRGENDKSHQCNTQMLHLTTDVNALWNGKVPFQGEGLEGLWYESNRENSRWVLEVSKSGLEYEGRYVQLTGKNLRFQDSELVLKGKLNEKGKLVGSVLIKYTDDIKELCPKTSDRWTPITFDVSPDKTRLQGLWQTFVIHPDKECREEKMGKMSYVLDRL